MNRIILATVILCMLLPAPAARAQEEASQPPCLPIAESALEVLEGTWTVDWLYRTAPGDFEQSVATSQFQLDLAGCAIVEHFEGTLRRAPFRAITVITRRPQGRFDRVRVDSEHGGLTLSTGHMQGDTLVFDWERPIGDRVVRTRHYYLEITREAFIVEFYLSRAIDAPWELVQRAEYRRSKRHR